MVSKLSIFLFLVAFFPLASALVARTPNPVPADSPLKERQVTRRQLVQRGLVKEARDKALTVKRNGTEIAKRQNGDPTTSGRVYPNCPGFQNLGYAHYAAWDYVGNDLPGNPHYLTQRTEAECVDFCSAQPNTPPSSACVGVVFLSDFGNPCFLKGTEFQFGEFRSSDSVHTTDMLGGCAAWATVVPSAMDAVCCNL